MSLDALHDSDFLPFCGNHRHYARWKAKTDDRFVISSGSFQHFVREHVSSVKHCKHMQSGMGGVFENTQNILDPRDLSQPLAEGFNNLCADFPTSKALRFVDVHASQLQFPSEASKRDEAIQLVKPDIVALLPGMRTVSGSSSEVWRSISLAVDVRCEGYPDPLASDHPEAVRARVRLMRLAGHQMVAHNSLCCFILSVLGRHMRVYRFDHAACIVSPLFHYRHNPDVLRMFLWSFVHPANGTAFFGLDDSYFEPTDADLNWAQKMSGADWDVSDIVHNKWIRVPSTCESDSPMEFLTLRCKSASDRVFSGATCVWEALLRGDKSGRRYIIKDVWHPLKQPNEPWFHRRIWQYAKERSMHMYGVAGLVLSVDMGSLPARSGLNLHRTISASLRAVEGAGRGDRSHIRLVSDTVGISLDEFERSKDFIQAIRDAVYGHLLAYKAGVLHCDVSSGNVMMTRGHPFKGFIHDFDLSVRVDSSSVGGTSLSPDLRALSEQELKITRGTPRFLAIEILESCKNPVTHRVVHDLQSFYWIIIYIVLLYTRHSIRDVYEVFRALFGSGPLVRLAREKRVWLARGRRVVIHNNEPLTHLLDRLHEIVSKSFASVYNPVPTPLDHEDFIRVLDEALFREGWPDDDEAELVDLTPLDNGTVPAVSTGGAHTATAVDLGTPVWLPSPSCQAMRSQQVGEVDLNLPGSHGAKPQRTSKRLREDDGEVARPSKRARYTRQILVSPKGSNVKPRTTKNWVGSPLKRLCPTLLSRLPWPLQDWMTQWAE